MAQIDYRQRHDNNARIIHWEISRKHRIETKDKGYDLKVENVIENGNAKLLWDFSI